MSQLHYSGGIEEKNTTQSIGNILLFQNGSWMNLTRMYNVSMLARRFSHAVSLVSLKGSSPTLDADRIILLIAASSVYFTLSSSL